MKISSLLTVVVVLCAAPDPFVLARLGEQTNDNVDVTSNTNEDNTRNLFSLPAGTGENTGTTVLVSVTYTYKHKLPDLCWDHATMGNADATTVFTGYPCPTDTSKILWDKLETQDASGNVITCANGSAASFSRHASATAWNDRYVGQCGVAPQIAALPVDWPSGTDGDLTLPEQTYTVKHRIPALCYSAGAAYGTSNSVRTKYYGTRCPDDNTKLIWNRMETLDVNGNLVTCTNGHLAIWNRGQQVPGLTVDEWNGSWVGSGCGVGPTQLQTVPTLYPVRTAELVPGGACEDSVGEDYQSTWHVLDQVTMWTGDGSDAINFCRNQGSQHVESAFRGVSFSETVSSSGTNLLACKYDKDENPVATPTYFDGTGPITGTTGNGLYFCFKVVV